MMIVRSDALPVPDDEAKTLASIFDEDKEPATAAHWSSAPPPKAKDDDADDDDTNNYKCWRVINGNYIASGATVGEVPAGVYTADTTNNGEAILRAVPFLTDQLYDLGDTVHHEVLERMQRFWAAEEKFRAAGMLYKTGVFLYGPPGCGKTCTIRALINVVVHQHNGLAFLAANVSPADLMEAMRQFRIIEPKRKLVMVYEDLEEYVETWKESAVLSMLDGENQADGVAHLATSNFPQRLGKRFLDRPSRFDLIRRIEMPTADSRRRYLAATYPGFPESWVAATEGLGIAHLRELIVATRCLDMDANEAIARLRNQRKLPKEPEGSGQAPGFMEK